MLRANNLRIVSKLLGFTVSFCLTCLFVFCQDYNPIVDSKTKKFKYYFNGGFGFYLPGNAKDVLKDRGSYTSISFQINYKDDLFGRLFFDNAVINYEKDAFSGGVSTQIRNKLNANFIGLDVGYNKSFKRFTPLLFIGAGLFTMDIPKIGFDTVSSIVNFSTERKDFFAFRGGASIEYEFSKVFILYLEGAYLSIPYKTELDNRRLNGLTIQLGFKTPLQ